ncbi:MAG: hypothetical protein KDK34_19445 [Leptospiraceae bacterium]|nr:hypothetical protein [Leptospiraceae bacterium]
MRLSDYDTGHQMQARVMESDRITPEGSGDEVRHLVLRVMRSPDRFEAGQSVGVAVPGPHAGGHEVHFRLYSIAVVSRGSSREVSDLELCVKHCFYDDEFNGEQYSGIASNYLCDLKAGDQITLSGPFENAFRIPPDPSANLLLIGMGTGIAPFRALIRHIYTKLGGWVGKVRLFYGARTGLELLYMNDKRDDLKHYYDQTTFKAFEAVSPRPHMEDPIPFEDLIGNNQAEVRELIDDPATFVYVAGLEKMIEPLDKAFIDMFGSEQEWRRRRRELESQRRWVELIY